MSKIRVGVIRGGVSTEREISLKTGSEIVANLNRDKYEVFDIVIDKENEVFEKVKDLNLDFAYIALHGVFGEDGRIQAILQSLGVAYSGPGVMSSAVCMDKEFSKRIVAGYGVRIAKWISVRRGETANFDEIKEKLGDEVVVKPNSGGSSIGVSFVSNQKELEAGLDLVFSMDKEALIEEVLTGVEISVPVIDGKVFPTIRIEALAGDYFDFESKYAKGGAKEYVYEFSEKVQNEINKFEKLKYENQNFYKAEIMTKEDSNYTISSHGIDIKGLVLKVGTVSNSDLGIIEDMVVNLIEVSDKRIMEDEARILYAQLLSDIKDDKLSNSIKYKNGITYAIQVERTGVLIFSAQ